jgi:uncharacterized protein YcnI
MHRSARARIGARAALVASLPLLAIALPASAHVTIPEGQVPGGGEGAVIHLRIPHGCEGAATDAIEVQIPEGVIGVTPEAVPGWTVETETVATDPYELYGATLTERTSVVRWSGGPLEDHQYLDFGINAIFPEDAGELTFPVVQRCGGAEEAWIQIPEEGQSEDDLERPAPTVAVVTEGADEPDLAAQVADLQQQVADLQARLDALENS